MINKKVKNLVADIEELFSINKYTVTNFYTKTKNNYTFIYVLELGENGDIPRIEIAPTEGIDKDFSMDLSFYSLSNFSKIVFFDGKIREIYKKYWNDKEKK